MGEVRLLPLKDRGPDPDLVALVARARTYVLSVPELMARQREWALGELMAIRPELSRGEAERRIDHALFDSYRRDAVDAALERGVITLREAAASIEDTIRAIEADRDELDRLTLADAGPGAHERVQIVDFLKRQALRRRDEQPSPVTAEGALVEAAYAIAAGRHLEGPAPDGLLPLADRDDALSVALNTADPVGGLDPFTDEAN